MSPHSDRIASALNTQRDTFRAFLAARVGPAEAEDILQDSLLKALLQAEQITDPGKVTAWFYRVLRNAVIDHFRRRSASHRRNTRLSQTLQALKEDTAPPPEWETPLCGCLGRIIDSMNPRAGELLRRVDLDGKSVGDAARALGISAGNASTTLHRARKELRARLAAFCGACADGACLDCHCAPSRDPV